MEDQIFSRVSGSWRVGEVAPRLFQDDKPLDLFSVPLSLGWAVFLLGKYKGISPDPEGTIVTPMGDVFHGDDLFSHIDATLLEADVSREKLRDFLLKAKLFRCKNVCLFPRDIPKALEFFPAPATVISFPHGADTSAMKVEEIRLMEAIGAHEFDVVADLHSMRDHDWQSFAEECQILRDSTGKTIKLILETALFHSTEILEASQIAQEAGIDYVKTSSGKNGRGASLEDIQVMRQAGDIKIKASGGIRTPEEAQMMLDAGADIIGASNLLPFLQ